MSIIHTDPCPSQFTYLPECDRCYRLNYQKLPWDEAAAACKAVGEHLIALETESEFKSFMSWYNSGND